jgi:DNA-binding XRE family transcriptional regulator
MVNNCRNRSIPYDIELVRQLYHIGVRRLKKRNTNGKSKRRLAKIVDISHPTLISILKDPDRKVSKRTMLKVVKATTKKKLTKPARIILPPAKWCKHTI